MKSVRMRRHHNRAFTLVELMVVVAIVMVMVSIILASIATARENTREKKRIADLANIEFSLTLYNEKERSYPSFDDGIEIGVSGAIDTLLALYGGSVPKDPKSAGTSGGGYAYWYDSDFDCYAEGQAVIYVRTMEQSKNGNYNEVCTLSTPDSTNGAGANSYIVVLNQ